MIACLTIVSPAFFYGIVVADEIVWIPGPSDRFLTGGLEKFLKIQFLFDFVD